MGQYGRQTAFSDSRMFLGMEEAEDLLLTDRAVVLRQGCRTRTATLEQIADVVGGQGPPGPQGEQGIQGEPGPPGDGVTLAQVIDALYPVGSLYISTLTTNPGALLGRGTWEAFGAGRVMVGLDSGDADFDTAEEVGGAKAVASAGTNSAPAFTGTPFSGVINHTHAVNITDPTHNHTQNSHNHTQDAHSHVITSQTATTGGATSYEHGTLDTSSADAEASEVTATTVATNQAATATNQAASTGITATTSNPAGGVASITPAGTVAAPTFTGSATSVVQPFVVVCAWKRVS